jgi:cell division protein FtsB
MRYSFVNGILLLLIGFFLINLVRSFFSVAEKGKVLTDAESRLLFVKDQNDRLKREYARTQSPDYIEKQAREKLNLGKDGEYVVLLPPISPIPTVMPTPILENWEKWAKVFR